MVEGFKHVNDLYLKLHANVNRTVHDIFLKNPTDKYNKKIYLQAKLLFDLRERIFKKLLHKGIIKSNPNQSDINMKKVLRESKMKKTSRRRKHQKRRWSH